MDNENINTNVNTDLQEQGSNNTDNGNKTPEGKTFTQEQVNDIVEKRLAKERKKLMGMIQDDEETRAELEKNRLELSVTKNLNNSGKYPVELAELVDYSDEDTCKKSYDKIIKIFDKAVEKRVDEIFKRNGRKPFGAGSSYGGDGETSGLRAAFGLKTKD